MERSGNIFSQVLLTIGGSEITVLELALIVLVVGGVVYWFRRQNRETPGAAASGEAIARLETRLATLLESQGHNHETLRKALDDRLETVSKRVTDNLDQTGQRTTKTLRELHERLALIDKAQENIKALSGEVTSLQALLSNNQKRGAFGEIQMQDIVKEYLAPSAYAFQHTLSNKTRVDCLIKLPDPPGSVAVDAKFPLASWRAYTEAPDPAAKETAARAFKADVIKHVGDIAGRYLAAEETADTALMFLPSEAVYATLHAEFADVIDKSFRLKVMIVSPTTFMATLHTMRAVMRDARMREQAGLIQAEVTKLGDDVKRLDDRVGALQRHFDQATDDVRQIRISTEKITRRADQITEASLGDETPEEVLPNPRKRLPEPAE